MTRRKGIAFSSVQLILEFTSYDTGEDIVWVTDAINLKLRRQSASGKVTETLHSYTSLEHVFLLLNQLEEGESETVLWGSSGVGVTFTND